MMSHIAISILVFLGVAESTRYQHSLGEVDVTTSYPAGLDTNATLTSGGLFQSNSARNQWLRIDLLELHFITSLRVYTGQGTQLDQIRLLGRVGGYTSHAPRLDGAYSWKELQTSSESNRVVFSPFNSGHEVPVYRTLAVFSTSNSGLVVDKVTFYGYGRNAFLPRGVTLNFSSSGAGYCATCQWKAPEGLSILASYKASLTGDPSLIEVGQNMSTRRCGYTRGQEATCEAAVEGATTSASRVQMVPCTAPSKPDVTGLINRVEVTHSGRRRWRYTVRWRASSTGCLYISRYEYSYQGGSIQNLTNNTNSMQVHADGAVRVTLSIRACNNQDICSVYDNYTSVITRIIRPQIAPLNFAMAAHSTRSDCVRLSWSPPQYPNGDITEYQYNCGGGWQSAGNGNSRSVECAGGGFDPYQSVTCQLKAGNSAGDSNVTTETSRTKCGKPSLPRSPRFGDRLVAMDSNRERWKYLFAWNVPSLEGCNNINHYEYSYNGDQVNRSTTTNLWFYVDGEQQTSFRVKACNNQFYCSDFQVPSLRGCNSISRYEYSYNGDELRSSTATHVWFYADGEAQVSFRVKACNNQNYCSDFHNSNTFTSPTLRPQIAPQDFTVRAHNTRSDCVRLSWSPPQYHNGEITEYQFNCGSGGWQSAGDGNTRSVECAGGGFDPYESITCQLKARNSAGESNVTTKTNRTKCAEPAAPVLNVMDSIDTSTGRERVTLNVTWQVVESNCESITGYKLTVSVANDGIVAQPAREFNGSLQYYSHVIRNLSAYTNYSVTITATNNEDHSTSAEIVHLTRELKPGPMNLQLSALDEVCVTLKWKVPELPNGQIARFQYKCSTLQIETDGIAWDYIDWVSVSAEITKQRSCVFRPGDRAVCKARAVNGAGSGPGALSNSVVVEEPQCPGVPHVGFASAVLPLKSTHGSKVIYECNVGYLISEGSSFLSCELDDSDSLKWKGTPPICNEKDGFALSSAQTVTVSTSAAAAVVIAVIAVVIFLLMKRRRDTQLTTHTGVSINTEYEEVGALPNRGVLLDELDVSQQKNNMYCNVGVSVNSSNEYESPADVLPARDSHVYDVC